MNIINILKLMASRLNVAENILLDAIKGKISDKELNDKITDPIRLTKINELLEIDAKLVQFGINNITQERTKNNFNKLKENLGQLQILILVKKLNDSKGCDDVINTLLTVLNAKFESINNVLVDNLMQTGGGEDDKYYKKYIKYKIKYLKLSEKL